MEATDLVLEIFNKKSFNNFYFNIPSWFVDKLIDVSILIFDLYNNYSLTFGDIVATVVRSLRIFSVTTNQIYNFLKFLPQLFSNFPSDIVREGSVYVLPQGGIDIGPLLVALVGLFICGHIPNLKDTKSICDELRLFLLLDTISGKAKLFLEKLLTFLPTVCENWIRKVVPLSNWFYENFTRDEVFNNWAKLSQEYVGGDHDKNLNFNFKHQSKLIELFEQSNKYVLDIANHKLENSNMGRLIFNINRELIKKKGIVDTAKGLTASRITPFCIYLTGERGVGKSLISLELAKVLSPKEVDPNNRVFSRNSAIKTWDGYFGQFTTCFDDFGQLTDGVDATEFILMISNQKYPLPMASLDNPVIGVKGAAFSSKLVICASNTPYPHPKTITCNDALLRRRNLLIEVVLKEDFKTINGLLDFNKIGDNFNHLDFYLLDPLRPTPRSRSYSYKQIKELCNNAFQTHLVRENLLLEKLNEEIILPQGLVDNVVKKWFPLAVINFCLLITSIIHWAFGYCKRKHLEVNFNDNFVEENTSFVQDQVNVEIESRIKYWQYIKLFLGVSVIGGFFLTFISLLKKKQKKKNIYKHRTMNTKNFNNFATKIEDRASFVEEGMTSGDLVTKKAIIKRVQVEGKESKSPLFYDFKKKNNLLTTEKSAIISKLPAPINFREEKDKICIILSPFYSEETFINVLKAIIEKYKKFNICFFLVPSGFVNKEEVPLVPFKNILKLLNIECVNFLNQDYKFFVVDEAIRSCSFVVQLLEFKENIVLIKDIDNFNEIESFLNILEDKNGVVPEGSTDSVAINLIRQTLVKNMIWVTVGEPGKSKTMCGICLENSTILVPYHLFLDLSGNLVLEHTRIVVDSTHMFLDKFSSSSLKRLESNAGTKKDVCIYVLSKGFTARCSIIKNFVHEKELTLFSRSVGVLLTYREKENLFMFTTFKAIEVPVSYYVGDTKINLHKGWKYDLPTQFGDCGSILIMLNSSLQHKIIGMHVAGGVNTDTGYGELVSFEMLNFKTEPYVVPIRPQGIQSIDHALVVPDGNFTLYGTFPSSKCPRITEKSTIISSLISGKLRPLISGPAVLVPSDNRLKVKMSPLVNGSSKYGKVRPYFSASDAEIVTSNLFNKINNLESNIPIRLLTLKETINGNLNIPFFEQINMSSSPGYPWILTRPKGEKGKAYLFNLVDENEYEIKNQDLLDSFNFCESEALQGRRVESIWIDSLKDERRSFEKISLGKTRVFTISPLVYTLLCRKYCLAFSAHVMFMRKYHFCKVGINPYSGEWSEMMYNLFEISGEGFAGDYSSFDGTLDPNCMYAFCDLINRFYNDEFSLVRKVIFSELVNTVQLCMNCVYLTHQGNPSGNPLTAILNSFVNAYYIRLAWMSLVPINYKPLSIFDNYVRDVNYGDDNLVAVHPDVQFYFNQISVTHFFETYGITYTTADKSLVIDPIGKLDSFTFLKNGFRLVNKVYLATLDESVIWEMPNWIRKCPEPKSQCLVVCQTALYFAYFHGFDFYQKIYNSIYLAFKEIGLKGTLFEYVELDIIYSVTGQLDILDIFETRFICPHEVQNAFEDIIAQGLNDYVVPQGLEESEVNNLGINIPESSVIQTNDLNFNTLAPNSILDSPWTVEDLGKRFSYVDTVTWNVSRPSGFVLASYTLPLDIIKTAPFFTPFEHFCFVRTSFVFRIQLNGTRFHLGKLIVVYVPAVDKKVATNLISLQRATIMPHVFVDAASSNVVELHCPFVSPYSFLKTSKLNTMNCGSILFLVLNQLSASPTTSQELYCTIFVQLKDPYFRVPCPKAHTSMSLLGFNFEAQAVPHGNSFATNTTVNNWGEIGSNALPSNVTGTNVDATVKLDKPNYVLQNHPIVRKPFGYLCNSNGFEFLHRLSFDSSSQNMPDITSFGGVAGETLIKNVISKYSLLSAVNWSTTSSVGSTLCTYPISPFMTKYNKGDLEKPLNLHNLHYISRLFNFWRGAILLKIQLVATQFHTGRLFLATNYGEDPTNSVQMYTGQYGLVIDLSSSERDFYFRLPFYSVTPWKCAPNNLDNLSGNQCGTWSLCVINPLVCPGDVSPTVNLNIFVAGDENFQLSFVSNMGASLYVKQIPQSKDDAPLAGEDLQPVTISATKENFVKTPRDNSFLGDVIPSLLDAMKRYCLVRQDYVSLNNYTSIGGLTAPVDFNRLDTNLKTYSASVTYDISRLMAGYDFNIHHGVPACAGTLTKILAMYSLYHGSLRFKILLTNVNNFEQASNVQDKYITAKYDLFAKNAQTCIYAGNNNGGAANIWEIRDIFDNPELITIDTIYVPLEPGGGVGRAVLRGAGSAMNNFYFLKAKAVPNEANKIQLDIYNNPAGYVLETSALDMFMWPKGTQFVEWKLREEQLQADKDIAKPVNFRTQIVFNPAFDKVKGEEYIAVSRNKYDFLGFSNFKLPNPLPYCQLFDTKSTKIPFDYQAPGNSVALDLSDPHALYHEIEVPFASRYQSLLTPTLCQNIQTGGTSDVHCRGIKFSNTDFGSLNINIAGGRKTCVLVSVLMSIGDDFVCGGLLGPPPVYVAKSMFDFTFVGQGKKYASLYPDKFFTYTGS